MPFRGRHSRWATGRQPRTACPSCHPGRGSLLPTLVQVVPTLVKEGQVAWVSKLIAIRPRLEPRGRGGLALVELNKQTRGHLLPRKRSPEWLPQARQA